MTSEQDIKEISRIVNDKEKHKEITFFRDLLSNTNLDSIKFDSDDKEYSGEISGIYYEKLVKDFEAIFRILDKYFK